MHRGLIYIEKSCSEEKKEDVILNMASPNAHFKLFYQTNLYVFFRNDITEIIIHILFTSADYKRKARVILVPVV